MNKKSSDNYNKLYKPGKEATDDELLKYVNDPNEQNKIEKEI